MRQAALFLGFFATLFGGQTLLRLAKQHIDALSAGDSFDFWFTFVGTACGEFVIAAALIYLGRRMRAMEKAMRRAPIDALRQRADENRKAVQS